MIWHLTKGLLNIFLILIAFIFLLLLPREIRVTHVFGWVFTAEYPFNWEVYKENIIHFVQYIQAEKGFGKTNTGIPVVQELWTLLGRSLLIIVPCFILSMVIGTFFGTLQFYYREKVFGKIISGFSWIMASIPDFFLFIALQYLLIKLMRIGLPHFSLYGHEQWYSFIIPVIAIMLFPTVHIAKFISTSLENEVGQEYVRTSYAKGLISMQVLFHMLKNCLSGLMHQTQVVMIYILTSLPIIEKLSSYRGAGYQLLESILNNEDSRALAFIIPFLIIMFVTIIIVETAKRRILPQIGGESA